MSTEERLALLMREALPHRELAVSISRADERRLRRLLESVNREMPDDPFDPDDDSDLAHALHGAADRGLVAGEADDNVWSDIDGRCYDLPRRVRAPWHRRLKFACRAARTTWRST